jgi:hypothetical protein
MNRAALAARIFLAVTILPTVGAAGYAVYEYHHQRAATIAYHPGADGWAGAWGAWPRRKLLGVFAPTLPREGRTVSDTRELAGFDRAVRHRAALTVAYLNWGSRFPARYISDTAKLGARTVLDVEPRGRGVPKLARIAAGRGDRWLMSFAASIVATRVPFILSFGPEMNGSWYAYGSGKSTARDYIRAFRHVHDKLIKDIGRARAARLIRFMWQPSAIHISTPSPARYWPGAGYVSVIGLDGYYYYPTDTFHIVFGRTIKVLRKLSSRTPIMVGETAVGPMTGHQAAGIKDLFAGIRRHRLAGLIWFDRNQMKLSYGHGKRVYHQNWRLQDHRAALRAFIAGLRADGPFARF